MSPLVKVLEVSDAAKVLGISTRFAPSTRPCLRTFFASAQVFG